jgi:hypothetical protein
MPTTRLQAKTGLVRKFYCPIDNACRALAAHKEMRRAIQRQIVKTSRRRTKKEWDTDSLTTIEEVAREYSKVVQFEERCTRWLATIKSLVSCEVHILLKRQVEEYNLGGPDPKIPMRVHRFLRIWDENRAMIRRGF